MLACLTGIELVAYGSGVRGSINLCTSPCVLVVCQRLIKLA